MPSRSVRRILLFFCLLLFTTLISSTASAVFTFYNSFPVGSFTSTHIPEAYTLDVISLSTLTPDPNDPQHRCLSNTPGNTVTGSYPVWFGFSVAAGTVSITTAGSDYNTIVTLYAYEPQAGNLTPLACNDNFTGFQAALSATVPTGRYVVQISRIDTDLQPQLSLQLDVDYDPTANPPANDARANASTATINYANGPALKTARSYTATIGADDATIITEIGCAMYNTVWYSYTPKFNGIYNFSTSGSKLYTNDNYVYTDTMLTVIDETLATAPVTCADGANYATAYNVPLVPGITYHIGVGTFNEVNLLPPSEYKLKITVSEILYHGGSAAILPNGSFESGDITGWKTKQFGINDGVVLDNSIDVGGDYALKIKAQNNGVVKSAATSRVFPSAGGFIPQAESALVANYQYITTGNVKGTVSLTIQYSNRPAAVVSKPLVSNSVGIISSSLYTTFLDKTVTKITLTVKVTSGNGTLLFDNAVVRYFGGQTLAVGRGGSLIPVPSAP